MAYKEIKTSIIINASPKKIWNILSDFPQYDSWNPFIRSVQGEFEVGMKVSINAGGMKFTPRILIFDKFREIRWIGHLFFKGIFDGEHSFRISENVDGSCTFYHEEKFNGLLVGLFSKKLDNETKPGFQQMNEKLKELAERAED